MRMLHIESLLWQTWLTTVKSVGEVIVPLDDVIRVCGIQNALETDLSCDTIIDGESYWSAVRILVPYPRFFELGGLSFLGLISWIQSKDNLYDSREYQPSLDLLIEENLSAC